MSYQTYQGQTIQQFIPNYVVKSDYLPTRVVDGNTAQTTQLVILKVMIVGSIRGCQEKRQSFHPETY
jgi:hypothetical protein